MIRAVALLLACLAVALPAGAQRAARQVSGDWITLGDVAPVTGDAATILIGPAPPAGQTLSLDPVFLVNTAKGAGVILAIPLDQPILVTRAAGNAKPAPVANPARPATPANVIAPQGIANQTLVLIRDVAKGSLIGAEDVAWQPVIPGRARSNVDADVAVGQEARRPLKAGQALMASDIKAPTVIRKGEPVSIVYVSPGVRLTVDGVAQADAALGDPVRVLNSYSKRSIDAVAAGHGEARVN